MEKVYKFCVRVQVHFITDINAIVEHYRTLKHGWMDGWMVGWTGGWTGGWTDGWKDGWIRWIRMDRCGCLRWIEELKAKK